MSKNIFHYRSQMITSQFHKAESHITCLIIWAKGVWLILCVVILDKMMSESCRVFPKWKIFRSISTIVLSFLLAPMLVSAGTRTLNSQFVNSTFTSTSADLLPQFVNFWWQPGQSGYHHVWPVKPTEKINFLFFIL